MQTEYDAIIIGAGPAGSTAASLLAQAGWSVAILEKQRFPRRKVCGECIAASNLPLLDALGVGDEFDALAGPELHRVALWCGRHTINAPLPADAAARHPWGRSLGREHLDTLLLQRARQLGACVLQPCTARSLGGTPGELRCEVTIDDDDQDDDDQALSRPAPLIIRAPLIINAMGSWQPLPAERAHARAHGRRVRHGADLLAFKANFRNVRLDEGLLPVLAFAGGYGGMVVADHGLTTVACCMRADRLHACRAASRGAPAGAAVEAYLRRECVAVAEALAQACPAGPWIAAGPIRPGIRLSGREPIFAIGNAAGEAHPIVGEGISMAMQSAWLLCALLVQRRDVLLRDARAQRPQRQLQQHYAAQWRASFGVRLRLAAWLAHAAMHPGATACLLPLARRAPGLLTRSARWSGKIRCAPGAESIALPACGT